MKRERADLRRLDGSIRWQSKPHRFFFWFCAVCLSLYLAYAAYLSGSALFASAAETAAALLWFFALTAVFFAALLWSTGIEGSRAVSATRARLDVRVWLLGAAVSLAILGVFLMAAYPGGVSVDSAVQWTQANTGRYSNWHPVFHTLLLRLCALILPDYAFAVAVQCAVFSACLGYLIMTLHAWGVKTLPLLIAEGLTVASPILGHTMMYLWKDNAMTLGVLLLSAQAVNLYFTRGAWLAKTRNALAFGLTLAFVTLVRHNAALFTLPLLIAVALCYRKRLRGTATAAAVLVAALALVWGPLYASLNVTYPGNTLEESIGVPMTVVCNIRKLNPDALDAETRAFTNRMADEEGWADYRLNEYNSIKFGDTREAVSHATLSQILRMAADTAKADPRDAFLAVNGVTDLVWGLGSENAADVTVRNSGDLPDVPRASGKLNRLGTTLKAFLTTPLQLNAVHWYYGNLGVSMALMLVFALRAIRRNGAAALTLCLPTLLYNLGTMCVLCGEDARFFSFSPLLCTLSLFVLSRDVPTDAPSCDGKAIA